MYNAISTLPVVAEALAMSLINSRKRFADHRVVFTPAWMVGPVKEEAKHIRRDFRVNFFTGMSTHTAPDLLFTKQAIFTPTKTWPPMTVHEVAPLALSNTPKEAT